MAITCGCLNVRALIAKWEEQIYLFLWSNRKPTHSGLWFTIWYYLCYCPVHMIRNIHVQWELNSKYYVICHVDVDKRFFFFWIDFFFILFLVSFWYSEYEISSNFIKNVLMKSIPLQIILTTTAMIITK